MVWYCDKCKSYHQDGQWCPNMGVLDPLVDFVGGVFKGYNEGREKADQEHKEWMHNFEEDNRQFRRNLAQIEMEEIAARSQAQQRRQAAEYEARMRQEEADREERNLRLKIQLEQEKQKTHQRRLDPAYVNDPFTILEIPRDSSRSQVIDAYRRLSQKWHPDKFVHFSDPNVAQLAHEKYMKIKDAYEKIKKMKGWV